MLIRIKLERDFKDSNENKFFENLCQELITNNPGLIELGYEDAEKVVLTFMNSKSKDELTRRRVAEYVCSILNYRNITDEDELADDLIIGTTMQVLQWIVSELLKEVTRLMQLQQSVSKYAV